MAVELKAERSTESRNSGTAELRESTADVADCLVDLSCEGPARGGELQAARAALEQTGPDLGLQRLDPVADGTLSSVQLCRRGGEAQVPSRDGKHVKGVDGRQPVVHVPSAWCSAPVRMSPFHGLLPPETRLFPGRRPTLIRPPSKSILMQRASQKWLPPPGARPPRSRARVQAEPDGLPGGSEVR